MDAPAMFTRKQVPEDVGHRTNAADESAAGQGQLHRDEKEHRPVLKKVKEKVKKIKHTLTGKSHGHGHGHDDEHGQHDERADEDDDGSSDYEEEGDAPLEREAAMEKGGYMEDVEDKTVDMEPDPEVHGAPMYDSERKPAVQDLVAKYDPARAPAAREAHGADAPGVRFGNLGGAAVHDPAVRCAQGADAPGAAFGNLGGAAVHDPAARYAQGADAPGARFGNLGASAVHDPATREAKRTDAPGVHFGDLGGGAIRDPAAREAHGADVPGVRFGNPGTAGVHDRAALEGRRDDSSKVRLGDLGGPVVEDPAAPRSTTPAAREGQDIGTTPVVKEFESMTLSDDPAHVGTGQKGARAEEWKDAAAEKMGGASGGATYTDKLKNVAAVPAEYGKKLASTVYEKVAGGGTAADAGKRDNEYTEAMPVSHSHAGGEEWKDAPEAVDTSTDHSSGPGYTDKIKSRAASTTEYGKQLASTVYEKVAGVGAAVAPSLRPQVGEGKQEEGHNRAMPASDVGAEERKEATVTDAADQPSGPGYTEKIKSAAAGTTEYGKQLASTVYEKVAGVSTAVVGKVQQATQSTGTATPGVGAQRDTSASTVTPGAGGPGNGQDKGVTMTGYIAEKLRPGDEERALSEAIAGAVQRRKEGVGGTVGQRVPAPSQVITKAREAVTSLTGGNRVTETAQPDAARVADAKDAVLRGEEIGEAKLNTNTM